MFKIFAVMLFSLLTVSFYSTSGFSQDDRLQRQQEVLDLINLPKAAAKARQVGYKDTDVKEIINLKKENKINTGDATEILNEAAISSREGDKVENLGSTVKSAVDEGQTGRDFANNIRDRNEIRKAERIEKERIRKEENERRARELQQAKKANKSKKVVKKSTAKKGKAAVTKKPTKKSAPTKAKKPTTKSNKKTPIKKKRK